MWKITGENNAGERAAEGEIESEKEREKSARQHVDEKGFGIAHEFYCWPKSEKLNDRKSTRGKNIIKKMAIKICRECYIGWLSL